MDRFFGICFFCFFGSVCCFWFWWIRWLYFCDVGGCWLSWSFFSFFWWVCLCVWSCDFVVLRKFCLVVFDLYWRVSGSWWVCFVWLGCLMWCECVRFICVFFVWCEICVIDGSWRIGWWVLVWRWWCWVIGVCFLWIMCISFFGDGCVDLRCLYLWLKIDGFGFWEECYRCFVESIFEDIEDCFWFEGLWVV